MFIKLKVDKNNLTKMINGEEFKAVYVNSSCDVSFKANTKISVYPEDIKEVYNHYVIVKERNH